ncbi:MAG: biotin--[acetyl-CoA-carboxylase] ligase [Coriobacteriales bacterium]
MDIKDQVLRMLEDDRTAWHSGEEMANRLGVSRAAVWKAIKGLRDGGHSIESGKNRGYRLGPDDDMLSSAGIEKHLGTSARNVRLEVFDTITSTNDRAREHAAAGEPEGCVVVAGQQTAGRGRFGRPFYSPSDSGLYLSLLTRPSLDADEAWLITPAAAVAVVEAVEQVTGRDAGIKWVNDVYLDGRKICGILTEAAVSMEAGSIDYAVVGIGINVYEPEGGFPPAIADRAGAIAAVHEAELRNRIAAAVITSFMSYYPHLRQRRFVESYRAHSIVSGRNLVVVKGDRRVPAFVLGVDDDLRLHVRCEDGSEEFLHSGEVSIDLESRG